MYASLGANLSRHAMPSLSIADPFLGGGARVTLCVLRFLIAKIREILKTFVPDWRGFATLGCAGSLGL